MVKPDLMSLTKRDLVELVEVYQSDSQRLTWWFTEGDDREAARNRIREKREKSKRYWSPLRWFQEIDKEMRKEAPDYLPISLLELPEDPAKGGAQ